MIISRTPFRISFFGGGTDYPVWYKQHGGSVLASSINKYCYVSCRYMPPFFKHKYRLAYSKVEDCLSLEDIEHPAMREALRHVGILDGVEIHYDADVPARSGIGSSSSLMVGLLHVLYALKGNVPEKYQLACDSIYLEQTVLKETVGCQDQISAAVGGFNRIDFHPDEQHNVSPIALTDDQMSELNNHLMLFFTGISRTASEIAKSYMQDLENKERELHLMTEMVEEGVTILRSKRDLIQFGQLLNEAWKVKRSLGSQVSNPIIDNIYERSITAGAIGGKITGAGGGGFLLLFVPPDRHKDVRSDLRPLIHVPFKLENSGTKIIFLEQDEDYSDSQL